jgi:hypothetical protein
MKKPSSAKKPAPATTIEPRGMTLNEVCAYWRVTPNTYRKLIERGIAPKGIRLSPTGKMIFDRKAVDAAMDAASKVAEVA